MWPSKDETSEFETRGADRTAGERPEAAEPGDQADAGDVLAARARVVRSPDDRGLFVGVSSSALGARAFACRGFERTGGGGGRGDSWAGAAREAEAPAEVMPVEIIEHETTLAADAPACLSVSRQEYHPIYETNPSSGCRCAFVGGGRL